MNMDPYEVLGVSRSASPDEIKKAYRQKARENHPDLNPDDPKAAERMNRVNEAYDRITNPQKYAREDARAAAQQAQQAGRASADGSAGAGWQSGWAWSGGATGYGRPGQAFNWDDIFNGFGGAYANGGAADWQSGGVSGIHPEANASDSSEVKGAIDAINAGRYQLAISLLAAVAPSERGARWYYLSALANYGAGNVTAAYEHIGRAVRIDSKNEDYLRAFDLITRSGRRYDEEAQTQGFSTSRNACVDCCALNACMDCLCPGSFFCCI